MEWVYMNKWAVIQYKEFILIQQLEVPHNHIYSQHRCITDNIQILHSKYNIVNLL